MQLVQQLYINNIFMEIKLLLFNQNKVFNNIISIQFPAFKF